MSDLLTTLFCMLAVFALADFFGSRQTKHLALSGIWTLLALLTKESSVHLLLLVPMCVLIEAGRNFRRDWRFGVFALLMLAAGGALLTVRLMSGTGIHGFQTLSQMVSHFPDWEQIRAKRASLSEIAPNLVLFLAGCGYLSSRRCRASATAQLYVGLSVAWLVSIVAFEFMSPAPALDRYLMPALIPLTMLVGSLLYAMRDSFIKNNRFVAGLLPAVIVAAVVLTAPATPNRGIRGYATAARSIPLQTDLVTLISSSSFGEGAFIAERLLADRHQQGIVLRGSKVLANSDWHDTNYQLLKKSPSEISAYLCEVPVHYVVIDTLLVQDSELTSDRELLQRAIEEHPADFRPVGRFPVSKGGIEINDAIVVYENVAARGRPHESLRVERENSVGNGLQIKNIPSTDDS